MWASGCTSRSIRTRSIRLRATRRPCSRRNHGRSGRIRHCGRWVHRCSSTAEPPPPETLSPAVEMARDFEDINNIEQLDDRELRGVIREHLAAHNGLDIDDITVE